MAKFKLLDLYKGFDIFGKSVSFNANGKETVNSCMGATMSLLVAFLTLAYAWTRFEILLSFGDTRYQETTSYREDLENEYFEQKDTNFNLAFGLMSHNGEELYPKESHESYLHLDVQMLGEDQTLGFHDCNAQDRQLFYEQADEGKIDQLEEEFVQLSCLDEPNQINLKANIFSNARNVLQISWYKCSGQTHCKSSEEIDKYINDHYIMLIFNQ